MTIFSASEIYKQHHFCGVTVMEDQKVNNSLYLIFSGLNYFEPDELLDYLAHRLTEKFKTPFRHVKGSNHITADLSKATNYSTERLGFFFQDVDGYDHQQLRDTARAYRLEVLRKTPISKLARDKYDEIRARIEETAGIILDVASDKLGITPEGREEILHTAVIKRMKHQVDDKIAKYADEHFNPNKIALEKGEAGTSRNKDKNKEATGAKKTG